MGGFVVQSRRDSNPEPPVLGVFAGGSPASRDRLFKPFGFSQISSGQLRWVQEWVQSFCRPRRRGRPQEGRLVVIAQSGRGWLPGETKRNTGNGHASPC